MKNLLNGLRLAACGLLLIASGGSWAATVYSESFTGIANGYQLSLVTPTIGQQWSVPGNPAQTVTGNAIATTSTVVAYGAFTNALSGGTLTFSVNFSAYTCNSGGSGNQGVSLFVDANESMYVGCSGGEGSSLKFGLNGASATTNLGTTTTGTVTITYNYSTGAYTVQAPGGPLVSGNTSTNLAINRLRVQGDSNGTITVTNFLATMPTSSETSQTVRWNLPNVDYPGCGKRLYGSFDYNAYYNQYTNVDLKYYDCVTTNTLTNVSSGSSNQLVASTSGQNNDPAAVLSDINPPLSNSGGSVSLTASVGTFNGTTSLTGAESRAATMSGSIPAPAAIPTLSEWSQMLLGLMVLSMIGWHFHRERSY